MCYFFFASHWFLLFFFYLVNFKGELHNNQKQENLFGVILAILYPEYDDEGSESNESDNDDDD
jgi:hypothetical protein